MQGVFKCVTLDRERVQEFYSMGAGFTGKESRKTWRQPSLGIAT